MVNAPILYMLSKRGRAGFSYSTRAVWLLLVAPLTVGKFVAPPRTSFPMVELHLDIMFGAPAFLLGGL
jgi:hypothetical protein